MHRWLNDWRASKLPDLCMNLRNMILVTVKGSKITMTWGWLVVCFFTLQVGLALAGKKQNGSISSSSPALTLIFFHTEISSAYPTSGGLH